MAGPTEILMLPIHEHCEYKLYMYPTGEPLLSIIETSARYNNMEVYQVTKAMQMCRDV